MKKVFLSILVGFCFAISQFASAASLSDIGSLTMLKSVNGKLYAAGSKGIAELSSPTEAIWATVLPETGIRLIEIAGNSIGFSGYELAGIEKSNSFWLNRLADKLNVSSTVAGALDLSGKVLWQKELSAKTRLSPPALGENLMAVNSCGELLLFNLSNGEAAGTAKNCNEVPGITSGMISQSLPNQPLIWNSAVYSTGFCKLLKTDLKGTELAAPKYFSLFKPFESITTPPLLFADQIVFGNSASGDVANKVFSAKPDLKDDNWTDFMDKKSGVSTLLAGKDLLIACSNYNVKAYNKKGKDEWEFDDIGLPVFRGVRYVSNSFASRVCQGNFVCMDEKSVYIAGYKKPKKGQPKNSNITVLDISNGKLLKRIDIPNEEEPIDMQLHNGQIWVLTPAGIRTFALN